ncbi:hypothetical protein [Seonamhaeicola maritimus]|uniref:hypothetical protein n=1 Tax=Seonamhaeicola maritimus TaxID=2591822 RepID=UPI002494C653|nr:hypothetical protein [Seonamhaeicola maritimus]
MFVFFICTSTYLGCSKDDSAIPCGTITDIRFTISMISGNTFYHLTVKLPDGSNRYDSVDSDTYNIGDEYCEATETTTPYR